MCFGGGTLFVPGLLCGEVMLDEGVAATFTLGSTGVVATEVEVEVGTVVSAAGLDSGEGGADAVVGVGPDRAPSLYAPNTPSPMSAAMPSPTMIATSMLGRDCTGMCASDERSIPVLPKPCIDARMSIKFGFELDGPPIGGGPIMMFGFGADEGPWPCCGSRGPVVDDALSVCGFAFERRSMRSRRFCVSTFGDANGASRNASSATD